MIDWVREAVPFGLVLMMVLGFVLYVWCLVSAAKNHKWVWFVLMLLFGPVSLAYVLFARKRPPVPRASTSN